MKSWFILPQQLLELFSAIFEGFPEITSKVLLRNWSNFLGNFLCKVLVVIGINCPTTPLKIPKEQLNRIRLCKVRDVKEELDVILISPGLDSVGKMATSIVQKYQGFLILFHLLGLMLQLLLKLLQKIPLPLLIVATFNELECFNSFLWYNSK